VLRDVQCIRQIMGGDGAELRCSSAAPVLVLGGLLEDMVCALPSKVS